MSKVTKDMSILEGGEVVLEDYENKIVIKDGHAYWVYKNETIVEHHPEVIFMQIASLNAQVYRCEAYLRALQRVGGGVEEVKV